MAASPPLKSEFRTEKKVRELDAQVLNLVPSATPEAEEEGVLRLESEIGDDDPIYKRVQLLLQDGYAGVVFRGPPGTSKTWYAAQIARKLVDGDSSKIRIVQFHPSYQYEDFVEGFVPRAGGFELHPKHLIEISEVARSNPDSVCVLVIDELSRADPARVLGEALTYIEASKRELEFRLASGRPFSIPSNLLLLGTMNVYDKGVDQIDSALERRLAYIAMDPDLALLEAILDGTRVQEPLRSAIRNFFVWITQHTNPYCRIGHAYFVSVRDLESLERLWENQLQFLFQRAFPVADAEGIAAIRKQWEAMTLSAASVTEVLAEAGEGGRVEESPETYDAGEEQRRVAESPKEYK